MSGAPATAEPSAEEIAHVETEEMTQTPAEDNDDATGSGQLNSTETTGKTEENNGKIHSEEKDTETDPNVSTKSDDSLDYDIPQRSEQIAAIAEEARLTMNQPYHPPDAAVPIDVVVTENDERFWETQDGGSCALYSFLYVIYRDSFLKRVFHSNIRKDEHNYYFYMRVEGAWYTFRVPIQTIIDEKANDKNMMYTSDWEFLLAVSVLCHVVTYMKLGFLDRVAFQPLLSTDFFFDQRFFPLGSRADIEQVRGEHFVLKTETHQLDLDADGTITREDQIKFCGHYIFTIGFYPPGFKCGHSTSVFFCHERHRWIYYSSFNDVKYDHPGENFVADLAPMKFNGVCILSGIAGELSEP